MGRIAEKMAAAMPTPRTTQAQMWDMISLVIENDTTVTGDLLRLRLNYYKFNREMLGSKADFIESVEAMTRNTGRILRDTG